MINTVISIWTEVSIGKYLVSIGNLKGTTIINHNEITVIYKEKCP